MKKFFCLLVFLGVLLCLSSCEYDKTQAVQSLFAPDCCYSAQLTMDKDRHAVVLSFYEDRVLSLRFTDGTLKGLEKIFESDTERHRFEETDFLLPSPTEYARIYQATDFLSRQHYVHPAPEEGVDRLTFEFTNSDVTYRLQTDLAASTLLCLEILSSQAPITLEFLDN